MSGNKAKPAWFEPELATLTRDRFSDHAWMYERKLDGERCLAFRDGGELRLMTRNRKMVSSTYPELAEALMAQQASDFVVDGEVVAFSDGQTRFAQLQQRMQIARPSADLLRTVPVQYYLFDVLWADGTDLRPQPLRERRQRLHQLLDFADPLRFTEHRVGDGVEFYQEACQQGWEGLIAKRADAPYVGGRTKDWLKFKCENNQEFVIGGYTDPQGSRTGLGALLLGVYDGDGQLVAQTDALTQTTRYAYDRRHRLLSSSDPLSRTTSYTYDLASRLTGQTDALGRQTTLGYDAAGAVTSLGYSDGSTPNVAWAYDVLGQRTVLTDGSGTTSYAYDSLGRPVSVQDGSGRTVGYGYDLAGRLTGLTYPGAGTVVYSYDAAGHLSTLRDWLNHTTRFSYDPAGRLTGQSYPNGIRLARGLDAAGQVVTLTQGLSNTTPLLAVTYSHDPGGLLQTAAEGGAGSHQYEYDARARLRGDNLQATTPLSSTWGYDAATQILALQAQAGLAPATTTSRSYDPAGELRTLVQQQAGLTSHNLSFTFDPLGQRTRQSDAVGGSAVDYGYDQAGRLTSVGTGPVVAGGGHRNGKTYTYNGDGLRTAKLPGGTPGCPTCATSRYTWDAGAGLPLLLQETAVTGPPTPKSTTTSYLYGPGGGVLAQVQGSRVYYYHADQLGSVRLLTNSTGAVQKTYAYDAYGAVISSTGDGGQPVWLRRGVQRRRERLGLPARPLLRPGHPAVPDGGSRPGRHRAAICLRGRQPDQCDRSEWSLGKCKFQGVTVSLDRDGTSAMLYCMLYCLGCVALSCMPAAPVDWSLAAAKHQLASGSVGGLILRCGSE